MQLNATMLDARASCGKPTLQLRWLSKRAAWSLKNFELWHSAANALSLQVGVPMRNLSAEGLDSEKLLSHYFAPQQTTWDTRRN